MTPDQLRSALESAGMPASELARRLGVENSTVFRWRAGKRSISRFVAPEIQRIISAYRHENTDRKNQS